ncbi:S24 family peptidase [Inquilinus limosus]|uniref:DNA-binding protein n=1 Tax=Inquilinus limosus MP06 TaxID=1398085 RepID=A0A0A0DA99_9PROT|nr:helix-turn-helix transcriptional regulator [Inquilinus limosus]KGM33867.1 DNA-binding protein [Inquilinus limosus MP06]
MLKHADIWAAIDRLARLNGLSPSGLARRAGLDPTTFNPSKRQSSDGKLRWPSTESISKILDATSSSMAAFVRLIDDGSGLPARRIPVIGLGQAGIEGLFDEAGHPTGKGWDEVDFPNLSDPSAYALEISGDAMAPIYRDGDVVVVSPAAGLRRGDRVVAKTAGEGLLIGELVRISANRIDLKPLAGDEAPQSLKLSDVVWKARIVWSSQ